jgi:hypothetical protein
MIKLMPPFLKKSDISSLRNLNHKKFMVLDRFAVLPVLSKLELFASPKLEGSPH